MIEPNDNELPGQTNAANGRTRSTRARASVPEPFRRLKWNEVVWSGEAPGVFRASSFARPIYRKEETERFRLTSTRKPKQKITAYLNQTAAGARASAPFLENHNLPYEDRDIINNPFNYTEMLEKRGAEPFALCRGQRAHAWPMSTGTK